MTTWLILFLFIIIAVITIVVLWVIWPDITGETQAPPPIALQAGFLDACNNVLQCGSGLTCEEGVCKRNIGGNCRILFDCVDDATACENGRCEIVDTGALNQPPNSDGSCENGLAVNSSGICKGEEGFSCSANGSCLSGECQGNACTAQKDAGLACSSNDNCSENLVCSKGFCQSINITTGTEENKTMIDEIRKDMKLKTLTFSTMKDIYDAISSFGTLTKKDLCTYCVNRKG